MWVGKAEGLCFEAGFLGDLARLLQCLQHTYLEVLEDPLKNDGPTDVPIFEGVLSIIIYE